MALKVGDKVVYVGNKKGKWYNSKNIGKTGIITAMHDRWGSYNRYRIDSFVGEAPFEYNLKLVKSQLTFTFMS